MKYALLIYLLSGPAPGPIWQTFLDRESCTFARGEIKAHVQPLLGSVYIDCFPLQTRPDPIR